MFVTQKLLLPLTLLSLLCAMGLSAAQAQTNAPASEKVLNLYSARHYATDETLYATFTKTTGIKINRVDSDDAGIISRSESRRLSFTRRFDFVGGCSTVNQGRF